MALENAAVLYNHFRLSNSLNKIGESRSPAATHVLFHFTLYDVSMQPFCSTVLLLRILVISQSKFFGTIADRRLLRPFLTVRFFRGSISKLASGTRFRGM